MAASFQEQVWTLVRRIPAGRVATYGQLGAMLGGPRLARQVGWAMAACEQAAEPVPWHRVINAAGEISDRGDPARAEHQRHLLEHEGVRFDHRGRVDLSRFQWPFPDLE